MSAVWLSRPRRRSTALADCLRAAGIAPLIEPAIEIEPLDSKEFSEYIAAPDHFALSIFVSAEAARRVRRASEKTGKMTAAAAAESYPAYPALAIGAATARALPPEYRVLHKTDDVSDTQHLLNLPLPQNNAGDIALIGGVSARLPAPAPDLAAGLTARGYRVFSVACYRRAPAPPNPALAARGRAGDITAAVAYSAETLDNMLAMIAPDNDWLKALPLFVIHPAIARAARARGFVRVMTTPPDAICEAIKNNLQNRA